MIQEMSKEMIDILVKAANKPGATHAKVEELHRVDEGIGSVDYATARRGMSESEPGSKQHDKYVTECSEIESMWMYNKSVFVYNLGWLLSQTYCGVDGCMLIDEDTIRVTFSDPFGDNTHVDVNVRMDSYEAIIKDVMKCL